MDRYEALGNSYSQEGLVKATANDFLFDYVAQWYYQMSKEDLKEVLLAVLGVVYDNCYGEDDGHALSEFLVNELQDRSFGVDEDYEY